MKVGDYVEIINVKKALPKDLGIAFRGKVVEFLPPMQLGMGKYAEIVRVELDGTGGFRMNIPVASLRVLTPLDLLSEV